MNSYEQLKKLHREKRNDFPEELSVRVHRSLSWLKKAETSTDDVDSAFIFYWISFNAAYSGVQTRTEFQTETTLFGVFFEKLLAADNNGQIYTIIWQRFSQEVKGILTNKFIYNGFWNEFLSTNSSDWKQSFEKSKLVVNMALASEDCHKILSILFSRIYVLRNQLFHGNATWNSAVNRQQVADCSKLLAHLVPVFLMIMMNVPNEKWGQLNYPLQQ